MDISHDGLQFPGRAGVSPAVLGVPPETFGEGGSRWVHACARHGRRDTRVAISIVTLR